MAPSAFIAAFTETSLPCMHDCGCSSEALANGQLPTCNRVAVDSTPGTYARDLACCATAAATAEPTSLHFAEPPRS